MAVNFKDELQKLANTTLGKQIGKQLESYDKRLKILVREFNITGQKAQAKSRRHLDQFARRLEATKKQVQKAVQKLLANEGAELNRAYKELRSTLKVLSAKEVAKKVKRPVAKKQAARPKKKAKAVSAISKPKSVTVSKVSEEKPAVERMSISAEKKSPVVVEENRDQSPVG